MNRCLAFIAALLCASLSVASACTAAPGEWIAFTAQPERGGDRVKVHFWTDENTRRGDSSWSTAFAPSQLAGFDIHGFRSGGTRPIRFALVREAGRLDCAGNGGNSHAAGNCRFTADPGFTQLLKVRGIGAPTHKEAFGLMALDVRREVIDAVASARYPTPTIDQLMALTAVGVSGAYIRDLASAGYRPKSIQNLIEFKALDITPAYAGGFARMGYANIAPDDLVQLKALDVTPEFVAGFERIGYRDLPVDTLVQLKALNITPEFVRSVERRPGEMPPVSELMQRKIFGRRR